MLKILVVDDDDIALAVAKKILETEQYDVLLANDGETALEILRSTDIQIVISDWNMPKITGIDLCHILRSALGAGYIYIILITTRSSKEDMLQGLTAGADDFISKPFDPAELLVCVRKAERMRTQQAKLLESENQFRSMFETHSAVMLLIEPKSGRILDANAAASHFYGYPGEQLKSMSINEINCMEPGQVATEHTLALHNQKNHFNFQHKLASGEIREVEAYSTPIHFNEEVVLFSIVHDITDRERMEKDLRKLERFTHNTIDALSVEIAILDETGLIVAVNRSWRELAAAELPASANLCEGANYLVVCDTTRGPDAVFAAAMAAGIRAVMQGTQDVFSLEYPCNDSASSELYVEKRWYKAQVTRFTGEGPLRIVVAHENISERKLAEEKIRLLNAELECLVFVDYLTGLYNRRYFMQRGAEEFKRARRSSQPLALFMLDIDWFKKVNDDHGHKAGDMALQNLAAVLKLNLREVDILGRIGGEEFAILLPNTSLNNAARLAERTRQSIENSSFVVLDQVLSFTISLGVAEITDEVSGIDDLLRNADLALYRAKAEGRNRVVVADMIVDAVSSNELHMKLTQDPAGL
jgi:diguanylate cyclase (GGDEF)-like protein/PAS domain S-box-containing protein